MQHMKETRKRKCKQIMKMGGEKKTFKRKKPTQTPHIHTIDIYTVHGMYRTGMLLVISIY